MNNGLEFAHKMGLAYNALCKSLCQQLNLPQTALDILLFLANNPDYTTASDIVEMRRIKANLVSVHVDRLVREGYLERRAMAGDRRKTQLCCTAQAAPVIEQGRQLQRLFSDRLMAHTDAPTRTAFLNALNIMEKNLDEMLKEAH